MVSAHQAQRPALRKRPLQARSAETVRVIVEAAARILESSGLGGFTTNAVAERAGVSIGSLYQYFPGKDAVLGALIVRETSALVTECEGALAAEDGRTVISMLIAAAVAHQLRRPVLARLLDVEEARLPFDEEGRRVIGRLREIVAQALLLPHLRPQADPATAAQDVLAIIRGMVDVAGERAELDQADLARRVARAVFGYLDAGD